MNKKPLRLFANVLVGAVASATLFLLNTRLGWGLPASTYIMPAFLVFGIDLYIKHSKQRG